MVGLLCRGMEARIYGIDDGRGIPSSTRSDRGVTNGSEVRDLLVKHLRVSDEAYLLPGCYISQSTSAPRNVVLRIPSAVTEKAVPYRLFSRDWAHGTSIVRLPDGAVDGFIHDPDARAAIFERLRNSISSELKNLSVAIGPSLRASSNIDLPEDADWVCGFDSDSCCAGVYAALEDRPPSGKLRPITPGTTRAHPAHYLVVKCGAGRAAEEFHSRLQDELRTGIGLTDALETISTEMTGSVDPQAVIKRLASVGRRNRSRVMVLLARALGIDATIDTMLDLAAGVHSTHQTAILQTDTVTNILEVEANDASHWLYFGGSVSPRHSQGIALCSNVADGFVLLEEVSGGVAQQRAETLVRNQLFGSLPYGSEMLMTSEEAFATVTADHTAADAAGTQAHPDAKWVRRHFAWQTPLSHSATRKQPEYDELVAEIEPPVLWGTHAPLALTSWARQLECHELSPLRLRPDLVLLAGGEPACVRSATKSILAERKRRQGKATEG